jgi:hypothetical protein
MLALVAGAQVWLPCRDVFSISDPIFAARQAT